MHVTMFSPPTMPDGDKLRVADAEEPAPRRILLLLAILPVAQFCVLVAIAETLVTLGLLPDPALVCGLLVGGVGILVGAGHRASRVSAELTAQQARRSERTEKDLARLSARVEQGREEVNWALNRVRKGEVSQPSDVSAPLGEEGPALDVHTELARAQKEAQEAVFAAAAAAQLLTDETDEQQTQLALAIVARLRRLVDLSTEAISDAERDVEDPDLLAALFTIDHLTMQTRRAVESLAILGGDLPDRELEPIPVALVLRKAVAEIESYSRVRVVMPDRNTELHGFAGPVVVHLLAELLDNATRFSPASSDVVVRATPVPAGVAIEVEDRGQPMPSERLHAMNRLLASPESVDLQEHIHEGHIGLVLVARLAARHRIRVTLRHNFLGGTQAIAVLPTPLLSHPGRPESPTADGPSRRLPAKRTTAPLKTEKTSPASPVTLQERPDVATARKAVAAESPSSTGAARPGQVSPASTVAVRVTSSVKPLWQAQAEGHADHASPDQRP
ncbi:ATP-binding protein [Streptomyces sp. NPDC051776]|uniref:sensor histidine kinase n=1 Tax=Streptomyces sp. NPDC051776 TaxID=3155414 RepID=UPI00343F7504